MSQRQQLTSLLQGTWKDPDTGVCVELPIQDIVIEAGVRKRILELFESVGVTGRLLLVADGNTYDVLGRFLKQELDSVYAVDEYVFSVPPKATDVSVEFVRKAVMQADCVVAVGSGTINDICKYASFLEGKPYVVWGTAPSMNGYASANAAIMVDGHKRSLACHAPQAIYMDVDILAEAPVRLIRSGVGDALCRSTAQIDWLLSHLVLGTSYKQAPFRLLEGDEAFFLRAGEALICADRDAVERLAYSLVLSGIGMMLCGGSYPASQAEHLIAHALDMKFPDVMVDFLHGEVIGVTTLTVAQRQQELLQLDGVPCLLYKRKEEICRFWGDVVGKQCWEAVEAKFGSVPVACVESIMGERWEGIVARLGGLVVQYRDLKAVLSSVGAYTECRDLGLQVASYKEVIEFAPTIRDRFTSLDVCI